MHGLSKLNNLKKPVNLAEVNSACIWQDQQNVHPLDIQFANNCYLWDKNGPPEKRRPVFMIVIQNTMFATSRSENL